MPHPEVRAVEKLWVPGLDSHDPDEPSDVEADASEEDEEQVDHEVGSHLT